MTYYRGMKLTPRGEKVLRAWENIKVIFTLLVLLFAMSVVGGIETGTIDFP